MNLPRVWIAPYLRGWSYDHTAQAMVRHLSHRFEFRLAYKEEIERHRRSYRDGVESELEAWNPDLVIDMWWHGTLHYEFGRKVMKQVSSHRWKMTKWGRLKPSNMLRQYADDIAMIVVPSRRLLALLLEVESPITREFMLAPKGFDPEKFFDYGLRCGELGVGWAGDTEATDKHIDCLLEAEPNTRLADKCLTYGEMPAFYNMIDIIAVASSDEGDPRPLIEGMACGCFPISTDVGIAPELIRHGHNGLIVDRTPQDFARAIAWCRENPRFIRARGRENAEWMRANRTWAHVMPAWGAAIDRGIERSRMPIAAVG